MSYPKTCTKHEVIYADEPFEFDVKYEEDVKGSRVGDPENCAAACALKRLTGAEHAWVKNTRTILRFPEKHAKYPGQYVRWLNPASLEQTVRNFDETAGLFPPGKYTLLCVPLPNRKRNKEHSKHTEDGTRPGASKRRPSYALR